jgi:hypothetical protein
MNATLTERPYVVGVFDNHHEADEAIRALLAAGFSANQMGFAMRDQRAPLNQTESAEAYGQAAVTRTSAGAAAGVLLGGALGAVSSLLIPGFGPVLLAGILVMAAGGGLAGGIAGLISTMELSEAEKHYYHHQLEVGRSLVFVKTGNRYSEAVAILETSGAHDIHREARTNGT